MKRQDTLKGWLLFSFVVGFILLLLPYIGAKHLTTPHKGMLYFFIVWGGFIVLLTAVALCINDDTDSRSRKNGDDVGHD